MNDICKKYETEFIWNVQNTFKKKKYIYLSTEVSSYLSDLSTEIFSYLSDLNIISCLLSFSYDVTV